MKREDVRRMDHSEALRALFDPRDGLQEAYNALAELIQDHQHFLVVAHQGPDGDAIGSTLAVCHMLWALGKDAVAFNVDPVPFNFEFLPGAERVVCALPEGMERPEVTLVLDCAEPSRVGAAFPELGWGQRVAVIDHHLTWDPDFAHLYVRDPEAAAVGEMAYRLALTLGAPVTDDFAQCVYTSIMTDTGGFRYGKTTVTTFQIASHLVAHGVDPWHINSNVYECEPLGRMRLLARVLDTLMLSPCGRLAFVTIDQEMVAQSGATPAMIDGFINYARRVQGVEVATQLRQLDPGRYKISFRSRGAVNVAALAEAFGGGGHHNAAGCVIEGDVASIQDQLSGRLSQLLGQAPSNAPS